MKIHLLLLSFLVIGILSGQEAFQIDEHKIEMAISVDGEINIKESQQITFSEKRRGIIRKIRYKYKVEGRSYNININDIHVDQHKYSTSKEKGSVVIKIGDANKYIIGRQQYDISYNVVGAILEYDNHHEFYWNVVGFESDAITERATFSIAFPQSWADSITQFRAFAGPKGVKTADINLNYNNGTITGSSVLPLQSREGITVAVSIPKGLIVHSSKTTAFNNSSKSNSPNKERPWWVKWLTAIPIALGGLLLLLWNSIKRSPDPSDIPSQYYVPDDLSPAEVGTFYDYKVNRRDIISLLPYWGNLGYLEIESVSEDDMYFRKVKDLDSERPNYEHTYFDALFENRNSVLLSELKHALPSTMYTVSSKVKKEVQDLELYDANSLWWHKGFLILIGILLILSGILMMAIVESIVPGIGLLLIGMTSLVLHFIAPRLSQKGKEYHNHLSGLYNWLKDPDPQEMADLLDKDPNYLQHIFPYVLAFGLDESWEKRWDTFEMAPPIWYSTYHRGAHNVNYGQFTKQFQAHKIEQVFYTPKPPAPSNGGGGGFSRSGGMGGGGFGGGSTSSW